MSNNHLNKMEPIEGRLAEQLKSQSARRAPSLFSRPARPRHGGNFIAWQFDFDE